jgi:hypothetical protein
VKRTLRLKGTIKEEGKDLTYKRFATMLQEDI